MSSLLTHMEMELQIFLLLATLTKMSREIKGVFFVLYNTSFDKRCKRGMTR